MKKLILCLTAIFLSDITTFAQNAFSSGLPQELRYEVYGRYRRPIKKEKLSEAKLISDVVPGYPVNWITKYLSVENQGISKGKTVKALSTNEALSTEQKDILSAVDLGSDVIVNVKYDYMNPVTNNIEKSIIHVSLTAVPEIEAEYIEGKEQLVKYLKENSQTKIFEITPKQFQSISIRFTVNEEGEIINANVFRSSAEPKIDKLLLDLINKMPKWKPAKNENGIKVKQDFEFTINNKMNGC